MIAFGSALLVAPGTGDGARLARVCLVEVINSDGLAQPDEPLLASGRFSPDNGTLALEGFSSAVPANGSKDYVVVIDMSDDEAHLDRLGVVLSIVAAVAGTEVVQATGLPLFGREVTVDTTPPSAPTGVTIIEGSGYLDLRWNPNTESDILGYEVWREEVASPGFVLVTPLVLKSAAFRDTSMVNGRQYRYMVYAVDDSRPDEP